jgi:hypothetical protein
MDNPLQNSLACTKCGRIFPKREFREERPMCPMCSGQELEPWMESPSWTFVLFGGLVLPVLGRVLVGIVKALGISALAVRYGAFAFVPAIVAVLNVLNYVVGHRTRNYMIKRGGQQGLLVVFGFLLALVVVVATGHYAALGF